ncbi:MAG: hypothetical protein WCG30_01645, partial [Candidatus Saccharibacteria bacterium]
YSLAVSGRYAYVANTGSASLMTIDISNPASPTVVGTTTTGISPISIAVSGRYAYVANYSVANMQIFDLGGEYASNLEAGTAQIGNLGVDNNLTIQGSESIASGLNVGGSVGIAGNLSSAGTINVTTTNSSSVVATLKAASGQTADILDLTNNSNTVVASFDNNGKLTSTGLTTSGADVNINSSSGNGNVSIGNNSNASNSVTIAGGSTGGINLNGYTNINSGTGTTANTTNINSGSTTSSSTTNIGTSYNGSNGGTVNIGNAKGSVAISGTISSSVTLQVGSGGSGGSTTAFLINNASGSQLLAADSINGQIIVGSSSNGVALSGSGLTLSGTAQRLRTITLTPEYSGAVLDCGSSTCPSNDIGTMTAGFDSTIANFSGSAWINGAGESYYNWTTSQGTNETYDVVVRVPIPSDWSGWNGTYPISIDTRASTTSGSTVSAFLFDTNGSAESSWNSCSVTVNTVWTKINPSCGLSGTYAADGIMTLRLRLASTGNNTQLGNIYLKYNSKW